MPDRLAISTLSLGRAWIHPLKSRLDAAQKYGYEGVEVFFDELEFLYDQSRPEKDSEKLLAAAHDIGKMCRERNLFIVSLGPFPHCEGRKDPQARKDMIELMSHWIEYAKALGTDIIQIPSSFLPAEQTTGDLEIVANDLREVAEMGQKHNLRFAYESLSWGTHSDIWERSWDVVQKVDRPNFGLCIDTFHIAGRVFADPTAADFKTPNAEEAIAKSVARLISSVDVSKIFYVEIADGERLTDPLGPSHPFYDPQLRPRMNWSRNCRLFYEETERGAFLPIRQIAKALLEMRENGGIGYDGWVSWEMFNRSLVDPSPQTPAEHAKRGVLGWKKLMQDVRFEGVPSIEEVNGLVHGQKQYMNGMNGFGKVKSVDGVIKLSCVNGVNRIKGTNGVR